MATDKPEKPQRNEGKHQNCAIDLFNYFQLQDEVASPIPNDCPQVQCMYGIKGIDDSHDAQIRNRRQPFFPEEQQHQRMSDNCQPCHKWCHKKKRRHKGLAQGNPAFFGRVLKTAKHGEGDAINGTVDGVHGHSGQFASLAVESKCLDGKGLADNEAGKVVVEAIQNAREKELVAEIDEHAEAPPGELKVGAKWTTPEKQQCGDDA